MIQAGGKRVQFLSHTVMETVNIGRRLGEAVRPGDVILLYGSLGAGKTAFTQGIASGMGLTAPVTSPSFTILKEYDEPGRIPLAHFDFYRIDPRRPVDMEFGDYIGGNGVSVIEWASRVPQIVPPSYLEVTIARLPRSEDHLQEQDALSQAEADGEGWRYIDAAAVGDSVNHLLQALADFDSQPKPGQGHAHIQMESQ